MPFFWRAAAAAVLLLSIAAFQTPITPQPIIPTPTPTTQPASPAIVPLDDARAAVCSAHTLSGFEPIIVTPGDTIRGLLNGSEVITVSQAAALNCIDDPDALPVGAVIWLPAAAFQLDATPAGCLYTWIEGVENAGCPSAPPTQTPGAAQVFERGLMVWVGETGEIFSLIDDGTVRVYGDTFVEGNPDPTAEPPDGLFTPVRGFGIVWEALGGAEGLLGWAAAQETSVQLAYQAAGRISYTTYFRVNTTVYAVTLYPGEESGYWVEIG